MIAPGAKVLCGQTGNRAWIVKAPAGDGLWQLISKFSDWHGQDGYTSRMAGAGDLTLIAPAKTYTPGETIKRRGVTLTVTRDLGDSVEFEVGQSTLVTPRGTRLRRPAGNLTIVTKADLTVENL